MDLIEISYAIGSKTDMEPESVGTIKFTSDKFDDRVLLKALKTSIKKLKAKDNKFIVGVMDVFVNRIKTYEVVILGDPNKTIKPKIYEV